MIVSCTHLSGRGVLSVAWPCKLRQETSTRNPFGITLLIFLRVFCAPLTRVGMFHKQYFLVASGTWQHPLHTRTAVNTLDLGSPTGIKDPFLAFTSPWSSVLYHGYTPVNHYVPVMHVTCSFIWQEPAAYCARDMMGPVPLRVHAQQYNNTAIQQQHHILVSERSIFSRGGKGWIILCAARGLHFFQRVIVAATHCQHFSRASASSTVHTPGATAL